MSLPGPFAAGHHPCHRGGLRRRPLPVRARPGRLSNVNILCSESILTGAFVCARWALNDPFGCFLTRGSVAPSATGETASVEALARSLKSPGVPLGGGTTTDAIAIYPTRVRAIPEAAPEEAPAPATTSGAARIGVYVAFGAAMASAHLL